MEEGEEGERKDRGMKNTYMYMYVSPTLTALQSLINAYPDFALVAIRVGDVVKNSVKIWSKTNHQYLHATIAHSRQLAKIW